MRDAQTISIDAPPAEVWALVSDITRTGEYSPETFEAEWLKGATGPAVGAKFRGHVRRSGKGPLVYWTVCRVTDCETERVFGFEVLGPKGPINTWRFELEPADEGTRLTESFAMAPSAVTKVYWALAGWIRGPFNRRNLRQSLERIKAVVEA